MFERLSTKTYSKLFIVAIIATLFLTLSVPTGIIQASLISDKTAHALVFFVLAFLYSHTAGKGYGVKEASLLIIFGLLIELIQYLLPWRSFSLLDWLADIAGIAGYEIIHRLKRLWMQKKV